MRFRQVLRHASILRPYNPKTALILLYPALEGPLWIFLGARNSIHTSKTLQLFPCAHENSFSPLVPIPTRGYACAYKQVQVNGVFISPLLSPALPLFIMTSL